MSSSLYLVMECWPDGTIKADNWAQFPSQDAAQNYAERCASDYHGRRFQVFRALTESCVDDRITRELP